MPKPGSKPRLAIGLLGVFLLVNLVYLAIERVYEPLAIPVTLGVVSVVVLYLVHRWDTKPPIYDRELRKLANQLQGLAAVVNLVPILRGSFLPFGCWAMEPSCLLRLMSHIQSERPDVIIECGSGLSTLLVGSLLRQNRRGHLYSAEEDEAWHRLMSQLIEDHNLDDYVTLIHAPLEPYAVGDAVEVEWYRTGDLSRGLASVERADVLLIDGPKTVETLSRYPALPFFSSLVDEQTLILLDDVNRAEEQSVIEEWQSLYCLRIDIDRTAERHQAYIHMKS